MAKDICMALGERIRSLRTDRGWRQIDLAEHAGLHENYISDLELGRKEVCLRTLHSLATALGTVMSRLLTDLD